MDIPLVLYTINFNKRQTKINKQTSSVGQTTGVEQTSSVEHIVEANVA